MCVYVDVEVAGNTENQQNSNLFSQSSAIQRLVYPDQNYT